MDVAGGRNIGFLPNILKLFPMLAELKKECHISQLDASTYGLGIIL